MSKAFVIVNAGQGEFADESVPAPSENQVLCAPLRVGLCGTDRLVFGGKMPAVQYPRIPGHEVAALVVENRSSRALAAGSFVCIDPYKNCGRCHACRAGRPNCCQYNQTLGVQRDGIMRERFLVDADRVYPLPKGVDPAVFCLVEPVTLGLHILQRAGNVAGKWCLVAGVGNVGRLLVCLLKERGAKVIAWDISDKRLESAGRWGADVAVNAKDPAAEERVYEVTKKDGVDVAFEVAGKPDAVETVLRLAAFAGKVVLVGHSTQASSVRGSDVVFKELDIVGSRNSHGQFPEAIRLIAADPGKWESMISHRFTFDHAADAFRLSHGDSDSFNKIAVDFPEKA